MIGAETISRILDWTDRTTCVLFGDGAGAVVMELRQGRRRRARHARHRLRSDGHYWDKLYTDGGPSSTQRMGHVRMEGKEVFKHAVGKITDVVDNVLDDDRLHASTISTGSCRTRPTSASSTAPASKLGMPPEKVVITVDRHANTSAASVPLALIDSRRRRPHQARRPGDDRSHGRRLHLGRLAHPLVAACRSAPLAFD